MEASLKTEEEILSQIEKFNTEWKKARNAKMQNKALRDLVQKIMYDKVNSEVTLGVIYK
ncbi:hypothetical protein SCACP_09180 [Sporomusa carbonis]|uniref:hypothetical protein n=1 Tax=Sporomusa carbonis TaxID=3076075 RepID=UPI003A5D3B84